MTWQPIETFPKSDEPTDENDVSKNSARVFLYFPEMKPSEIIGYRRATFTYGGIFYEWCDDNGDQIELQSGRIEPSHWAPMFPEPTP